MHENDGFRLKAHQYLLDLDATTSHLMMLVIAADTSGTNWSDAVDRQKSAYEAWVSILSVIETDPMPALDGRSTRGTPPAAE
ncbi:hypothetical protein [Pseudomonas sp. R16(2017)]|uniref:hypothetical protein n=1 Tax=Pseudomonas sp. R16(2017) TaxID=1981704 RepID=UPI00111C7783|nr:hypothetical protein [Pseudomonas sp. R16(2017)]